MSLLGSVDLHPASRLPDWRWREVMASVAVPSASLRGVSGDILLYNACNFMRKLKQGDKCEKTYPHILAAFQIYTDISGSSIRWLIEALAIGGCSAQEIARTLTSSRPFPRKTIQAYLGLYFDVEQYGDNRSLLKLKTCMQRAGSANPSVYDADFAWKMLSFEKGYSEFLQVILGAAPFNKSTQRWFQEHCRDRLTLAAFEAAEDIRLTGNEQSVYILKMASDYWNISSGKTSASEQDAKRKFLEELSEAVSVTLMESEKRYGEEEAVSLSDFTDAQL